MMSVYSRQRIRCHSFFIHTFFPSLNSSGGFKYFFHDFTFHTSPSRAFPKASTSVDIFTNAIFGPNRSFRLFLGGFSPSLVAAHAVIDPQYSRIARSRKEHNSSNSTFSYVCMLEDWMWRASIFLCSFDPLHFDSYTYLNKANFHAQQRRWSLVLF